MEDQDISHYEKLHLTEKEPLVPLWYDFGHWGSKMWRIHQG